jgi:hypothetical protein
MAERCEMDLSPGTVTAPSICVADLMVRFIFNSQEMKTD